MWLITGSEGTRKQARDLGVFEGLQRAQKLTLGWQGSDDGFPSGLSFLNDRVDVDSTRDVRSKAKERNAKNSSLEKGNSKMVSPLCFLSSLLLLLVFLLVFPLSSPLFLPIVIQLTSITDTVFRRDSEDDICYQGNHVIKCCHGAVGCHTVLWVGEGGEARMRGRERRRS